MRALIADEYARGTCSPGDLQDRFVEQYENDLRAVPSYRVRGRFREGSTADALASLERARTKIARSPDFFRT